MNTLSIIVTAIGTLFGGAFGAYLTNRLGHRKQDEIEFSSLIKEYRELVLEYKEKYSELLTEHKHDVLSLRKELAIIKVELANKDKEIIQLRNQLMIFESSHADVPIPIWLKDTSGVMLYLNDEYERVVLHPINKTAKDYIGKKDVNIWGEEIAKKLSYNDKIIMRTKKPMEVEECWVDAADNTWCGRIIKYPRFLNRKTVIGVGGILIDRWKVKPDDNTDLPLEPIEIEHE